VVSVNNMTANLSLTGAANYLDIRGGTFSLDQANGPGVTNVGGIDFQGSPGRTSTTAVVLSGGEFVRGAVGTGEVDIAGTVTNGGGMLGLDNGVLKINGVDDSGRSYWQLGGFLLIASGEKFIGAGTLQIDSGDVDFQVIGGAPTVAIQSAGLIFGNLADTSLNFVDLNTPGTVAVVGPVTLAANTTTTMNFKATAPSSADLLDVRQGTLTLAGDLVLLGDQKPKNPLNFLDSSDIGAQIAGGFATITDDVGGKKDTGAILTVNQQLVYYQVTIQ
jgi:hypothetical protein